MAEYSKGKQRSSTRRMYKEAPGYGQVTVLKETHPYEKDPMKEQFEPTDNMPVRQHVKMAGGA